MNDRELLELAAKAAGFEWRYEDDGRMSVFMCDRRWIFWNPLTDDGDAFRLSCLLRISVTHRVEEVRVANRYISAIYENVGGDRAAATRRAIVRAAVATGAAL